MATKRDIRNELKSKSKKDIFKILVKLFKYIMSVDNRIIFELFSLKFIQTMSPILRLYLLQEIINDAIQKDLNYTFIVILIITTVLSDFINNLVNTREKQYMKELTLKCNLDLNKKILELELKDLEDKEVYNNMQRADQATYLFQYYNRELIEMMFRTLSIVSYTLILLTFNFYLVVILFIPIIYLVYRKALVLKENFIVRWEMSEKERRRGYYAMTLREEKNISELKILNKDKLFYEKFKTNEEIYLKTNLENDLRTIKATKNIEYVKSITSTTYLVFLLTKLVDGTIQIGNFNTYREAFSYMFNGFERNLRTLTDLTVDSVELNEFFNFLEYKSEYIDGTKELKEINTIEFKNVSFKYKENLPYVLKDVSFKLEKGVSSAFIGPNGSGKTTIMKLIAKVYKVTEGEIFINGININEFKLKSLRDKIGYLSQEFMIFQESVKDNIIMGNKNVTDKNALKLIYSDDMKKRIKEMPEKINTVLGNWFGDGINFSGGQKQKLALSRIFAKDAHFLLLDEPNAALDPRSEYDLFRHIDGLKKDKTCIVTLHIFTNIDSLDNVIMFEDGQVVANGHHKDLYKNNLKYKEFYDLQERKEEN